MRCVIIDDDELSVELMQQFVAQTDFLELGASYTDPLKGAAALLNEPFDLLLLDVEMPSMTGLDIIENLPRGAQVILITSNKDYAVDAFEHEVTDFLLKPVSYPRFLKAAVKARNTERATLLNTTSAPQSNLYVKEESVWVNIPISDIVWVEALGDYVTIHMADKKHTVLATMKTIESKLPAEQFMRIHRSYIININKISNLDGNIVVLNKKLLPIGKSYKKGLMDRLNIV